jgi:DNA (cytosine-5)-methyltransferase 1
LERQQSGGATHGSVDGPEHGSDCARWPTEPDVGRVADGIPIRAHRIKSLGNAIVPQAAFQIIKAIAEIETQ